MRIVSWNINGLRAYMRSSNDPLKNLFNRLNADIICLQVQWSIPISKCPLAHSAILWKQETKLADLSSLTKEITCIPSYDSFFSFSTRKKGYSGVATFAKKGTTLSFTDGFQHPDHSDEGRCIVSDHGHFVLFNVYFVNGATGDARQSYKMKFYRDFQEKVHSYLKSGRQVIITGDVNTAHTDLDIYNSKVTSFFYITIQVICFKKTNYSFISQKFANGSGFLPEERAWIDSILSMGFKDAYRHYYPIQRKYTFWDTRTGKRKSNEGWRIDYFLVSDGLMNNRVTNSEILTQVSNSFTSYVMAKGFSWNDEFV